ncbi:MAG: LacI family DNA-binding transcriptional regulator [Lachnospiraceae bacterium]|nr:LacI family DNA-binding transcriptional regulator [Lachnospiraceae bacterium]
MKIKDIAAKAGVSTATVSNVINGNFHKVSEKTIRRVQKIIEENDYQPSAMARSLALKESRIIGVVMPYLGEDEAFSASPYYEKMLSFLEKFVRKQGYYLMIRSVGECKEMIPVFTTWNVDGLILLGPNREEVAEIEKRINIPTVYIDSYAPDADIVNVGIDDYKGGYLAAEYLMEKGHRKIAYVGPDQAESGVVNERFRGFCDALQSRGIVVTEEQIFKTWTIYNEGVDAGKRIAYSDMQFTAVVTMSDILAFGVMEGLRLCGLDVPQDISVVGFDNLPECCYSYPQLTTVSQNMQRKAELAGEYLFKMIEHKEKLVINEKIGVELIERQSVRELHS